ncbi:hypothetical protein HELRODRAFT_165373 [Helobdella robusta]|uniref:SGNH hydrolase-type esterase domain-containing protein n=1 Tax=Helobdella robusta TaxID=6412 RepID=T1EWN8_HELRO|nr:hypothetical protein HELRODRAFT_165373 [Helobdella robusta]ESN91350.1 hypothetical protein HELRODRAFT_165373 [Helobdella robusta]
MKNDVITQGNKRVLLKGKPGGRIGGLINFFRKHTIPIETIILYIGGNDLATETPELVAARYESLLRLLENKIRPRRIIILSLVYRKDVQKWKVDKLNVSLKQFQSNIVHFWKLDRVGGGNNIGLDGIHLNERGMMNFKRNIIYSLKCTK